MSDQTFMYPSVSQVPQPSREIGAGGAERGRKGEAPTKGEFDQVLKKTTEKSAPEGIASNDGKLSQARVPLKFSSHASQRIQERRIPMDAELMKRVNDAVDKAAAKGVEDTLILTGDSALIINVPNRTVVTAMDRKALTGNVFTNIDGAVIL